MILFLDKPVKALFNEGADLVKYLQARHPPAEEAEIRSKGNEIQQQIEARRKNRTL
jgi:hypothetical protein